MPETVTPAVVPESSLLRRLRAHFDAEPAGLPVIQQDFAIYERPNLHLAIQELVDKPDSRPELVGIVVTDEYRGVSLSRLSREASARKFDEGPVEYVDVPLADDRQLACVKTGLQLFRDDGRPIVLLITEAGFSHSPAIRIEIMATDR